MNAKLEDYVEHHPLDLFFTRSGSWLSKGILWATQEEGEPRSEASHVGCIVSSGTIRQVYAIEALRRVRRHSLWNKYGNSKHELNIFRPTNIRPIDEVRILEDLERQVGRRYGYAKIALHLFRKLTGDPRWLQFSRLDQFPICSYLVARSFEKYGYDFGIKGSIATPDDMHDFCVANPDKWLMLRPWERLSAA